MQNGSELCSSSCHQGDTKLKQLTIFKSLTVMITKLDLIAKLNLIKRETKLFPTHPAQSESASL